MFNSAVVLGQVLNEDWKCVTLFDSKVPQVDLDDVMSFSLAFPHDLQGCRYVAAELRVEVFEVLAGGERRRSTRWQSRSPALDRLHIRVGLSMPRSMPVPSSPRLDPKARSRNVLKLSNTPTLQYLVPSRANRSLLQMRSTVRGVPILTPPQILTSCRCLRRPKPTA